MLAAACGSPPAAEGPGGPGGRGAAPALPVDMVTLEPQPVERTDEFVGTIRSRRSTTIQPQAEGFLLKILVTPGQRVSPGTPMFEIDSTTLQAAVAGLRSVRAAREADAEFAKQQAERAKSLLAVGAGSKQEYEQAVAQQKTTEATLKAIDEQIRQQQAELAYYQVTAPTEGTVGDIPSRIGDRVTRSTALTTIEANSGLEVYVNVPVHQAPNLKVGLPIRIVNDTGELLTTTRAAFVSPSVDDTTQTVLVKAPIESRGGTFRSDQFVRARIVFSLTEGLTIPVVAVNRINGQYFVFVAEAGDKGLVAKQRSVTLGPVMGNSYLVLAGLKAGEKLIVSGIQKIGEGAPVQATAPGAPKPGDGGVKPGEGGATKGKG
jgi:RND family efflux transporter MFP subunit